MPGCQVVAAKAPCMFAKFTELDFPIAKDIGIWCSPTFILLQKLVEHAILVLAREIDVVQRNIQLRTDIARVLKVGGGCAIATVVFPIGHMQRLHFCALFLQ